MFYNTNIRLLICVACTVGIVAINGLNYINLREEDSPANGSCTISGKTVNDGEMFDLAFTGPCIKYLCSNGSIFPGQYGCERAGKCYPIGDSYTMDCIERVCAPTNGRFGYIKASEGCQYKSMCLPVGSSILERCFKYQCSKTETGNSVTYSVTLADWGCEYENQCYPDNHTLSVDCKTMRCQNINNVVGFRGETQGCQYSSKCLKVGETTVDSCNTYQCQMEDLGGVPFYSVTIISTLCEDVNNDCKAPGQYFSYNMGGVLRHNCTCQIMSTTSVQYRC